ncbi:MAG TPA: isoprenylcysteine carboxylmethyltransferase family protein [bacterium]|nr:isoprenylcysteine carboxylmethyltransferase family protein [bacterium]
MTVADPMRDYFGIGGGLAAVTLAGMAAAVGLEAAYGHGFPPVLAVMPAVAGTLMIGAGLALNALAARQMIRAVQQETLATAGPFAWSRNPMYASFIFLTVPGAALVLRNWFMLVLVSAVMLAWFYARVGREEQKLTAMFGGEYRAYQARVGRLLPRLGRRPMR